MALTIPVDQIQQRAATVRPVRGLLTVLALPFLLIGILLAVLWVAVSWIWAAGVVGFLTVRDRARVSDHDAG